MYQKAAEARQNGELDEEWIRQHTTKRLYKHPRGVEKLGSRFKSKICFQGKYYSLGAYDTPAEAGSVYKKAKSMIESEGQLDEDWMSQNHNFSSSRRIILILLLRGTQTRQIQERQHKLKCYTLWGPASILLITPISVDS